MRHWKPLVGMIVAGFLGLALPAIGLAQDKALTVRGKIVRVESPDRYIVQTSDNKEVTFYASPKTRYVINGKAGRSADVRVGSEISAAYTIADDRHHLNVVTVGVATDTPPRSVEKTVVRGKIIRTSDDQVIIRSTDGKEVTLVTTGKTRFLMRGKPAKRAEFRIGTEVYGYYIERDGQLVSETVSVGEVVVDPAEATYIQGTVIKVVGEDQVIVRGANNKEITVYVNPTTKYTFEDQPGRFTDIRSGSDIRIEYDVRDRRNLARSIIGVRRNKK